MLKFETESTVKKLITMDLIIYFCMHHSMADSDGNDDHYNLDKLVVNAFFQAWSWLFAAN